MTLKQALAQKGNTDWARLAAEEAAGIEPADDGEDEFDWANSVLVQAPVKEPISIRLDDDILSFFRAEGKGYQSRINAVLRAYVQAKMRRRDDGDAAP